MSATHLCTDVSTVTFLQQVNPLKCSGIRWLHFRHSDAHCERQSTWMSETKNV